MNGNYNFLLMCFISFWNIVKNRKKYDPKMKLSICDAKIMNSFGDFFQNFKKVGFWKIQISKIFWMTLKWKIYENWSLDISKASISCLSHPSMSITTWFMSVFAIACMWKITHFFIFHREKEKKNGALVFRPVSGVIWGADSEKCIG